MFKSIFSVLSLFALGLYSFETLASPPRPTGGRIDAKLIISPNQINQIKAGTFPRGQAVSATLTFLYPKLGNPGNQPRAHVIFEPLDSTISASGPGVSGLQLDSSNSTYEDAVAYQVNLVNHVPDSTISIPVTWTPTGTIGASARVTVIVKLPEGDLSGKAAYTVGVVSGGQSIRAMSSTEIYQAQLSAMKQNLSATGRLLESKPEHEAPFVPENHPEAMSKDSLSFDYDLQD